MSATGMKPLLFFTIFVSMLVHATGTTETEISSFLEHDNRQLNTMASILQQMASSIRNQEVYHNQTTLIHSQIERNLSQLADTQTRMATDQEASQNQTTLTLSQLANTQYQLVNAQAEMANAQAEMASVLNQVVRMLHDMNECFARPCQNQGQCVNGDNGYGYTCECQAGWTGVNCEKDVDECASIPCQNGGLCIDGVNNYACQCVDGWTGILCEIDIDDCASALCLNGGQCIDGVNQYMCQCIAGWTGTSCEINPPCQADLFTCYDGSCIPSNLVCDGVPDCEHSTDEVETMCATCPYKFLCTNGRCVELEDVCDGTDNCEDNSDEDRICVDIPTAIASVDGSTITLQWNALLELTGNPKRNITQYVVTVTRQDGGESQTVFVPAVDDTAYNVTGLQPVTAYVFEIDVVIDTDGQGEQTYNIGIPEVKANTTTSCLDYLGMENGDIPDRNIKASTYYSTGHSPHYARLNGVRGWLAMGSTNRNPWIQADIGYQTYVSGVATQGNTGYWVTSFKVSTFSTTTSNPETYILDNGGYIKVFQGNTDFRSIVTSTFPEPVIARIVRITCLEKGAYHWGMRFEILGCKQVK